MSNTILKLVFAAPLQSWGVESSYPSVRDTASLPTRSGIIGLLANARGLEREDSLAAYEDLIIAVRADQPGQKMRDYHTTLPFKGSNSKLSQRYYIEDAVFVVFIEGDEGVIETIVEDIKRPARPVFFGRKSCVPSRPLFLGLDKEKSLQEAIVAEPWQASKRVQKKHKSPEIPIMVALEVPAGTPASKMTRDVPKTFSIAKREYGYRYVSQQYVSLQNPSAIPDLHDPFLLAREAI